MFLLLVGDLGFTRVSVSFVFWELPSFIWCTQSQQNIKPTLRRTVPPPPLTTILDFVTEEVEKFTNTCRSSSERSRPELGKERRAQIKCVRIPWFKGIGKFDTLFM